MRARARDVLLGGRHPDLTHRDTHITHAFPDGCRGAHEQPRRPSRRHPRAREHGLWATRPAGWAAPDLRMRARRRTRVLRSPALPDGPDQTQSNKPDLELVPPREPRTLPSPTPVAPAYNPTLPKTLPVELAEVHVSLLPEGDGPQVLTQVWLEQGLFRWHHGAGALRKRREQLGLRDGDRLCGVERRRAGAERQASSRSKAKAFG